MDDNDIVSLYLNRDESAITESSLKYGKRLRAIAQSILNDSLSAEECENSAYMHAWTSIPPHEPRTYLFPFLARITRHVSLDYCRKNHRIKRSAHVVELSFEMEQCIPSSTVDTVDKHIEADELCTIISKFLRGLPEISRCVFIRRYWYMDSIAVLAKTFLLSENNVKSMLWRTRKKLRKYLEKEGYHL